LYEFLSPMHATCPTHLNLDLNHPNNIWWRAQIKMLLIMQFSPSSCYFLQTEICSVPSSETLSIYDFA
jgi:hypothetical protein